MSTYNEYIKKLAQVGGSIFFEMDQRLHNSSSPAKEYVRQYACELTDDEWKAAQQYHTTGMFSYLEDKERIAATSMVLNAEYLRDLQNAKSACAKYSENDIIFQNSCIKDACIENELIDYSRICRIDNSNLFKSNIKWLAGDPRIPMIFYHWLDDCFKNKPRSIRINPNVLSSSQPTQMVVEMLVQPPVKDWWKDLRIYKGTQKGSWYRLSGDDPNQKQDYYDYHVYHVRELETCVSRDNSGHLSILMEELSEFVNPVNPAEKYVLGRMIHLDTDAQIGTSYEDATLNHIDLAENFYQDDLAEIRLATPIYKQRIKTDDRTHILRVKDIPFSSVIKFAYAFFKSKQLVDDWKQNEFI